MKDLYTYIFESIPIEDKLIRLYQDNVDSLSRHCKVHLMTRGNLIGMFSRDKMTDILKNNAETLSQVIGLFQTDIDKVLNDYVLIGYRSDERKKNIGKLFESVNDKYKKFLCLVTILEMTYTYQRVDMLNLIDFCKIESIVNDNIELIESCIKEDKYNYKKKAATKYINSIFFVSNLKRSLVQLNNIKFDKMFYDELVDYYTKLYNEKPNATTIYGITHVLIGASDFYQKRIDKIFNPLVNILYNVVSDKQSFDKLTLDLRIEVLLCCKLFGREFDVDMTKYIDCTNLEENEHTNMLYILLKKHRIK
jgi:hypothetical protein